MRSWQGCATLLAALSATAWALPAQAQQPEATCPATPAPLPGPLAGWRDAQPVESQAGVHGDDPALALGKAVDARLHPGSEVTFVAAPGKSAGEAQAGLLAFDAPTDGSYRVALGSAAWIDVIEDGKPVASTAHGHGPACSGIRKMVDFPLKRGRHILQISGGPDAVARVLVVEVR